MDEEEIVVSLCFIIIASAIHIMKKKTRRRRSRWVRDWIKRRKNHGAHHALVNELSDEDPRCLKNFLRMDMNDFQELLGKVSPYFERKDTCMREALSASERLSITLRFLATGDSYHSLEYLYRIPVPTLSTLIPETCQAIYESLREECLTVPNTEAEWKQISSEFYDRWNFPHCIGAMDGKHIAIKCPANSGSVFHNYKNFFSIVLFAIVDADYKFLYIDVGRNGRISDGGIFANTPIYHKLESDQLRLPRSEPLPGRVTSIPYVIVGDDAFPLKNYLMKPYPTRHLDMRQRVFNYRLSRVRRIVENVFGILASRFAVFQKPISLEPEKVEKVILASCALHNFLRSKPLSRNIYSPQEYFDNENNGNENVQQAEWRHDNVTLRGLIQQGGNRSTIQAREIREEFCDYVNTNGQVPWQWNLI